MQSTIQLAALASGMALVMCACTPAPKNKIIHGQIAAFADATASPFVGGIRYDISNAIITDEGVPVDSSVLEVGMKTRLIARPKDLALDNMYAANVESADRNCDTLELNDEVEGEVLSIAVNANLTGTMNVMGQTITIKPETVFKSKVTGIDTLDQVLPGMIVEVYGDGDGLGDISATRVELKKTKLAEYLLGNRDGVKVKGIVTNLDTTAKTFTIGGATIDYSSPDVRIELKNGIIANNLDVKVYAKTPVGPGGTVTATKIKLKDNGIYGEQGGEGQEMEMEGKVTTALSGDKFKLNGAYVIFDSNTVFDGIAATDLIKGTEVEVKGAFRNGKFYATYISPGESAQLRTAGVITSINPTGVNSGSIVVLGDTYIINNETIMLFNGSTYSHSLLNLGGLDVNDVVTIDYFIDPDTQTNIAVKVSR